jgi:hypothetical protein
MPKLPSGVYDLPVTVELGRALAALDPGRWAATREAPDSADSHELCLKVARCRPAPASLLTRWSIPLKATAPSGRRVAVN